MRVRVRVRVRIRVNPNPNPDLPWKLGAWPKKVARTSAHASSELFERAWLGLGLGSGLELGLGC